MLLPQEFSLTLTDGKLQEAGVQVWSNAPIPQGVRVYPFQGTVRLDKLQVFGYLNPTDVSTMLTRVSKRRDAAADFC